MGKNAELQPAGMHRRPGLLMAVNNVISNLTKVLTLNKLLAISFFLSIELPVVIEARPVDGETGDVLPTLPQELISQVGCLLGCEDGESQTDFGVDLSQFFSQINPADLGISPLNGDQFDKGPLSDSAIFGFPDPSFSPVVVLLGEDEEGNSAHIVLGQEEDVTDTTKSGVISGVL